MSTLTEQSAIWGGDGNDNIAGTAKPDSIHGDDGDFVLPAMAMI